MNANSISMPQGASFQASLGTASNMSDFKSSSDGAAGQIASLLGDALFKKSGSGSTIGDAKNPLLGMIADYMDKSPGEFGKPDDANGKVRNWRDELGEDNYLDANETKAFTKGLEGLIKDILGGGTQDTKGLGTNNNGGWDQKQKVGDAGGSDDIQALLSALLGSLGEEKLDNLLKPTGDAARDGRGEMEFSNDDKDVLKEVSRFMDMHPEEFGKPDGKSKDWMGELSEGDQFMSRGESEQFQKAINMIKAEVKDSAQGNSLGGLFPDAEQNFANGGAGNTLKTDASITAGNVLSVLTQQSATSYRS
ncbi:DNA-binding protein [Pseudomonas sp. NPDC086278]|uniref:DNA-binding protein n=1 Tax=Pseudomonas sp. NPDC086278 TaxID=3390646 RepID=UPI003CFE2FAC